MTQERWARFALPTLRLCWGLMVLPAMRSIVRGRRVAPRHHEGLPLVKNQKSAERDRGKAERVIPAERLLQIEHREGREHGQRDHFLDGLELGGGIDRAAP